jgi:hypothetical protein
LQGELRVEALEYFADRGHLVGHLASNVPRCVCVVGRRLVLKRLAELLERLQPLAHPLSIHRHKLLVGVCNLPPAHHGVMTGDDQPDFTPEERLFIKRCAERGVAINVVEYELDMAYFNIDQGYVKPKDPKNPFELAWKHIVERH